MKTLFRRFIKRRVTFSIIVISLIVAFTSTFLITGFVVNEYAVDSFHKNRDRIFRLLSDDPWVEGATFPHITKAAPEYIKNTFPEVVEYSQWNKNSFIKIEADNKTFFKDFSIYDTDPAFFKLFSYNLKEGDLSTIFADKSNIVLSEKSATKIFGTDKALGKSLAIEHRSGEKNYFVSGVIETPKNSSHLEFDMLTSIEGKKFRGSHAYLLLKDDAVASVYEKKLQSHKDDIPFFKSGTSVNYYLEDLSSIHLTRELKTKIRIFVIIAILILFVAFFNYFNLISSQIFEREDELKIKRIIGGSYFEIVNSLALEFSVMVIVSVIISFFSIKLFLPVFNSINDSVLVFSDFFHFIILAAVILITFLVILLSYFAVYIYIRRRSRIGVLKPGKAYKIPIISTFQFAVSSALIICTLFIVKQIKYIHNKDIGLNRDIAEMRLPPLDKDKSLIFKEMLLEDPAIEKVSICSASPVREGIILLHTYIENGESKEYSTLLFLGDNNYINTLGIEILEGHNFFETAKQNKNKCLINQSMVNLLELKNPVGKILPGSKKEIIGIVRDFHWNSLENKIPPTMIVYTSKGSNILVEMNPVLQQKAISHIKSSWNKVITSHPFEYWTIGDWFNKKHEKFELFVRFITFFCFLAIFLSVIGLISRSILSINNKTKEIGIRKINGAKVFEVLTMLNTDFVKWVVVAFIIATPLSYYAMNKWLENFAYKTTMSWWIFALAGVLALGIALLTVSWQSWKAATRNPVEALRYE
jgi:putative ABC transport system permease protein